MSTQQPYPSRIFGSAEFSPCGQYRYELTRSWDASCPAIAFVMLNPSTADAAVDDPTIRRCIGFANRWGYGELRVYNVFALRSTEPAALWQHPDPKGPRNAQFIQRADECERIVCAWGSFANKGRLLEEAMVVPGILLRHVDLYALASNADGQPRHPLYVRADAAAQLWRKGTPLP